MENTQTPEENKNQQVLVQQTLPNSAAVLVMGILSIAICWCYGLIGIILGIIALNLAGKANRLYNDNPEKYSIGSFKNMRAGRVCAIIGLVVSSIYFLVILFYLFIVGTAIFTLTPWEQFL